MRVLSRLLTAKASEIENRQADRKSKQNRQDQKLLSKTGYQKQAVKKTVKNIKKIDTLLQICYHLL